MYIKKFSRWYREHAAQNDLIGLPSSIALRDAIKRIAYRAWGHGKRIEKRKQKRHISLLQAELETYRWIPVGERLPDCYTATTEYDIRQYLVSDGEMGWITTWRENGTWWEQHSRAITHWMPIPISSKE